MKYHIPTTGSFVRTGLGVTTAVMIALASHGAQAHVELCPGPPVPGATGTTFTNGSSCNIMSTSTSVLALFVGHNAADDDHLSLPVGLPAGTIFDNFTTTPGTMATLTVPSSGTVLDFTLTNTATGGVYVSGVGATNTDAGAFSPVYHFAYDSVSNLADYNSINAGVPLTVPSLAVIAANGGFSAWTFAFAEDLSAASTDDWNDIVYAFHDVTMKVPEPASLALLGVGLVGLGLIRCRRG